MVAAAADNNDNAQSLLLVRACVLVHGSMIAAAKQHQHLLTVKVSALAL